MRILFDYLPGVGAAEVAEAMRQSPQIRRSFVINSSSDVRDYAMMPTETRRSKRLIHGLKAGNIAKMMPAETRRVTLVCHPAERVARAYEQYRLDSGSFLHPICMAHPIERVIEMVPEFRDLMTMQFDPRVYDVIAITPAAMLDSLGISEPSVKVQPDEETAPPPLSLEVSPVANLKRNDRDLALWDWIVSQAGDSGVWRPRL